MAKIRRRARIGNTILGGLAVVAVLLAVVTFQNPHHHSTAEAVSGPSSFARMSAVITSRLCPKKVVYSTGKLTGDHDVIKVTADANGSSFTVKPVKPGYVLSNGAFEPRKNVQLTDDASNPAAIHVTTLGPLSHFVICAVRLRPPGSTNPLTA